MGVFTHAREGHQDRKSLTEAQYPVYRDEQIEGKGLRECSVPAHGTIRLLDTARVARMSAKGIDGPMTGFLQNEVCLQHYCIVVSSPMLAISFQNLGLTGF